MVKKLFALASVTALAGLVSAVGVAGCTTEAAAPTDTPEDDAGTKPKKDSGPATGDTEDDEEPLCYDETPLDISGIEYHGARPATPGACAPSFDKTINDFIKANPQGTWDQLKAELVSKEGSACAECIFSKDSDDKWGAIVQVDTGAGLNIGACIGLVSDNEACGEAFYAWDLCINVACKDCEQGSTCGSDVQQSACKEASEAVATACGNNANAYLTACSSLAKSVTVQCVSGVPGGGKDAGTDAGPDAGDNN